MHSTRRGYVCRPRHRIAGFSLIELLIVISIIVLLLGIALPTMRYAQRTARTKVCQSNLSGIGQAINQWLEDRNQTYPGFTVTYEDASGTTVTDDVGYYNWGGQTGTETYEGSDLPTENRPLFDYSGASGFQCPLDRGSTRNGTSTTPAYEKFGTSYTAGDRPTPSFPSDSPPFDTAGDKGWWFVEAHRSSQIEQPGKKLIMADIILLSSHSPDDYVNQWHGTSAPMFANGVFADGHVELIRRDNSGPDNPADVDAANAWANDDRPYY